MRRSSLAVPLLVAGAGLIALLYVGICFAPVIFDDNEGLYAGAVREMHATRRLARADEQRLPARAKTAAGLLDDARLHVPFRRKRVRPAPAQRAGDRGLDRGDLPDHAPAWAASASASPRRWCWPRCSGVWIFTHLVQPEPFLACFISLGFWCLVEARLSRTRVAGKPGAFRATLVFPLLDFSRARRDEQGPARRALAAGHGGLLTALFVPGWRPWLRPILQACAAFSFFFCISLPWYAYMAARFPGFSLRPFHQRATGRGPEYPLSRRCPPASARAILRPASALLDALDFAPAGARSMPRCDGSPARGAGDFRRAGDDSIEAARVFGVAADPGVGRLFHAAGLLQHELLGRRSPLFWRCPG